MKHVRRISLILLLLLALAIGAIPFLLGSRSNYPVVHNSTPHELRDVELLLLQSTTGRTVVSQKVASILPGSSVRFRHREQDLKASLTFTHAGKTQTFHQPYVDFWTGESWVFNIRPDGTVSTGYWLKP